MELEVEVAGSSWLRRGQCIGGRGGAVLGGGVGLVLVGGAGWGAQALRYTCGVVNWTLAGWRFVVRQACRRSGPGAWQHVCAIKAQSHVPVHRKK